MFKGLKKTASLARLISTVITCAALGFYFCYLLSAISNGVGSKTASIMFCIITAVLFVARILLYSKIIKRGTSRRLKRLCRIIRILTQIFTLSVTVYNISLGGAILAILVLPIWFIQLVAEIIGGIIESAGRKIGRDIMGLTNGLRGKEKE